MSKDSILSIIIICYNNESYIEKCIESVIQKDNKDLEIIVVNDGSTDNSLKLIKKYSKYVKIISTDNYGLSHARNVGIKEATGKYLLFIDGDDYIVNESIPKILDYIKNNDDDLVLLNTIKYYEKSNTFEKEILPNKNIINEKYLINNKICGRAWRFLYKRSIIKNNNILFHESLIYEDEEWVPKAIYYSKKISFLDIPYYIYRKRDKSITSNKSFNNISNLMKIVESTYEWNEEVKWDSKYLFYSLSRCIKNIYSSLNYLNEDESKNIIEWNKKNKKMINKILSGNKKLKYSIKMFGKQKGVNYYKKHFNYKIKKEMIDSI